MKSRELNPMRMLTAICAFAATALLFSCAGNNGNGAIPAANSDAPLANHKTFSYTGEAQFFKVPAGVKTLQIIAIGGLGAGAAGGYPGRVSATIAVTPGERLIVYVGGNGKDASGGFNGGGDGDTYESTYSYGGGGATDIRKGGNSYYERLLVAGGGGGQGANDAIGGQEYGNGGKGGSKTGGSGAEGYCGYATCDNTSGYTLAGGGGTGGTQESGGTGGSGGSYSTFGSFGGNGHEGVLAFGGRGGTCHYSRSGCYGTVNAAGGGGGGGYYGGGGGGGGGGGSSYVERSAIKVHTWQGWKASGGVVVFSW